MQEIGQKTPRKMRTSISQKTLFSILLIALVLGVTAIVIGYSVYSSTMDDHYLDNTIKLAHTISALVDQDTVQKYGELILGRYNESTEEMREKAAEVMESLEEVRRALERDLC